MGIPLKIGQEFKRKIEKIEKCFSVDPVSHLRFESRTSFAEFERRVQPTHLRMPIQHRFPLRNIPKGSAAREGILTVCIKEFQYLTFRPSGMKALSRSEDLTRKARDMYSDRESLTSTEHSDFVSSADVRPYGKRIASRSAD